MKKDVYLHNNGIPLTASEFQRLYASSNRKVRRRLDAMKRRGVKVAPDAPKTEEPTP